MVDRGRLEICCTLRGTGGSNPSLSAESRAYVWLFSSLSVANAENIAPNRLIMIKFTHQVVGKMKPFSSFGIKPWLI